LADFTPATFTGSTALSAGTGTQPVFYDSSDGFLTMMIDDPAGGWHWTCTADPSSPETIYGYYLTDNAGAVLLGAGRLATPVTISASGQGIIIGAVTLKLTPSALF